MGTRETIRNPQAYEKRQAERRRDFEKKVEVAKLHIVDVLNRHFDGELKADTQDEAFDLLIASGSLGAMVSARRIARVMKHQNQTQQKLSRRDRFRRDDAAKVIDEAIDQLEAEGELTITVSFQRTVIVATEKPKLLSPLLLKHLEITEAATTDPYELYSPRKYIRMGRAKVDSRIYE